VQSPIPISEFDASSVDIDQAVTLPPAAFTSREFYEFELEAIWGREWVCVGRATDVPKAGDYYTVTLGDEPLIVLRDTAGDVAVLSAVCQHRGMIVAEGCGNARRLRCPYHSWVYGLDGRLLSAPDLNDVESFDRGEVRLPRVRSEVWEGFVFVTFDETIPPVSERLGRLSEQLADWEIATLRAPEPMQLEPGEWNWKLYSDECYHCAYLHAKTWNRMFPTPSTAVDCASHVNDEARGIFAYEIQGREVASAPTHDGKAIHPLLPRLDDEQLSKLHYVTVMPNLLIICMPDKVKAFIWLPTGPTSSAISFNWLFPEETMSDPGFLERWKKEKGDLSGVVEEDLYAWSGVQRGLRSRFAPRGRFAPSESVVLSFNRWLIERYRAAHREPEPAAAG
jgi:phenylpropionate dioxygenase-like ring-hydroxylating dioxygenase large terminal subunit